MAEPLQDDVPEVEPESKSLGRFGAQNVVVVLGQVLGWAALLFVVDRPEVPLPVRAVAVVLLCFVLQGVFSMMHEYFHRNAHRNPVVNYGIGVVGSLLFGTSATLHRVNHWGHHVRNRTEAEQGDFIHPDETPLKKVTLYYFAVLGGLWLAGVVVPLVALLVPYRAITVLSRTGRFNTYAAAFAQFKARDWMAMRLEGLALVAFWWALVQWGPWRWQTLAVVYAAFAVSWSSLQWVYHLRTPLHRVEGAYNLRAPLLVRTLFLNFNYNLTHHRLPALAWQELPAHTEIKETQPLWYRWALMVKPPVRRPDDEAALLRMTAKTYF